MDAEVDENDNLIGTFVHGDNNYKAKCDCSNSEKEDKKEEKDKSVCELKKLNIVQERKGEASLTLPEAETLIGAVEDIKLVEVRTSSFKCLDGRHKKAILGAPGGDMGEFILGLMVYEDLLQKKLTQTEIEKYFTLYLAGMEQDLFAVCTDDQAVSHLETQANVEGLNIHDPEEDSVKDLLKRIVEPENIGDLHLKSLLKFPSKYFIRAELVKGALTAFFKAYWDENSENHGKLQLIVLPGIHKEKAFAEISTGEKCFKEGKAPLVHTKRDKAEMFVNHRKAAQIRKAFTAKFFVVDVNQNQDDISEKIMRDRLEHHGNQQLETTGSIIAGKKSFFSVDLM